MKDNKYDKEKRQVEREKKRQELEERYEEDWKFCKQVFSPRNSIKEYLGDLDGDVEWSNNAEGAYKKFININAYRMFCEKEKLILIGRTGTGKSSILNRYAYAINSSEIQEFNLVVNIKFENFFDRLKQYSFGSNYNPENYIKDGIEIIIKLCVIQYLALLWKENDKLFNYEIEKFSVYLKQVGITQYTNIVEEISEKMDFSHKPDDDLRDVILNIKKIYVGIKNEEIEKALDVILSQNKIIVLSDSVDYYDITEKKVIIINKALIDLVFDYNIQYNKRKILLKAAIPSEIYTHISEAIVTKRRSKVVTIEWGYKDLIRMIALKVFCYASDCEYAVKFTEDFEMGDMYNYEKAVAFLDKMLPKYCQACIPLDFETLPYCIRHTQKKPRQLIIIFNFFIDKISDEENFVFFMQNKDLISEYVHKAQQDIISDALNMYNIIAKEKVLTIVKSVLYKRRNFLNEIDLNDAIKSAASVFRGLGLQNNDIKQILIESGLVGQLYEEWYVEENSGFFNNKSVIKICIALFEYQIKDTLPLKVETYVLHPMCYEYYSNEINYNALVYPFPSDDIEDNVINNLNNENAIF